MPPFADMAPPETGQTCPHADRSRPPSELEPAAWGRAILSGKQFPSGKRFPEAALVWIP